MAECSKCGRDAMTFTCKYCGEKFCSEHRLPENHDCGSMEEEIEKQKEEQDSEQWFQEKEVRKPAPSQRAKKRQKPSIIDEIRNILSRNYTLGIIGVTTLVFMLQLFMGSSPTSNSFYNLFILKPGLEQVLTQPWTLLTVMFIHAGYIHLFANMITLYFFGTAVERTIGSQKFLKLYFLFGLVASIGFVAARNVMAISQGSSVLGPAVGASGAVIAMFALVAMLYPEAEVLLYFVIPMKIKTALYAFAGLETVNLMAKAAGIYLPVIGNFASSAHLAGLLIGVWYGKKLQGRHQRRTSVFDPLGY